MKSVDKNQKREQKLSEEKNNLKIIKRSEHYKILLLKGELQLRRAASWALVRISENKSYWRSEEVLTPAEVVGTIFSVTS